jgi:DNA-binding SARP family transcriptional activator
MTHPPPRLHLGAAPQWQLGDKPPQPLAAPDALLLAWLAIEGPTPRERVAALLWPESAPEAARNTLRQRLFRLRRATGFEWVAGQSLLALAEGVKHDLAADRPLLAGLDVAAAGSRDSALAAWLGQQRQARGMHRRQVLLQRIESLEAAGEAAAALPLALELLAIDPLAEDGHRRVMRLHYLQGDRAAALRAFDALEQRLKHELGTRPGAETLALLASIEAQTAPTSAAVLAQRPLPVAVLRPPRQIGRARETGWLLDRWWRGGPGLALVLGEAGLGKSRLLAGLVEAATAGRTTSATTAPATCPTLASARPGDSLVPYSSLARLLRAWSGAREATEWLPADTRRALVALVPEWAPPDTPVPPRDGDPVDAASAPRELPAQAVGALLAAAAGSGHPAAWVLDDLHFADAATLAALPLLVQAPECALRLALGSRPAAAGTPLEATLRALADAVPGLLRLELQPLSTPELAELVDSLGLPQARGDELAPLLRQHSGGNPLFALETLKAALKAGLGLAGGSGGAWALATALPKPESLRQLIQQQLARLSPPALNLARLVALAGSDFSLALAAAVLERHVLDLADPWAELEAQQVLLADGSFAHDLVFEAVLGAVPALIARHLHGRIAQALEDGAQRDAAGGAEPSPEPSRVAHHWEAAGQPQRALAHWRAAAERAHRGWREEERIAFLLRAADIAEAAGERSVAFDSIAAAVDAHMDVLRDARGFALLERLDRLAGSERERALALGHRAWYLGQLAETPDHAEAARLGAQALALADAAGDTTLAATTRERLGTTLSLLGRFDEALSHLEAVRPWAERHHGPGALASYHGNTAVVLDNLGRPAQALEHHHAALAASHALGDRAQQVTHRSNLAVNRLNAGDAGAALAAADAGQAIVAEWGLSGGSVAFLFAVQCQAARALGRWRLARSSAEQAIEQLEQHHPARVPMVLLHSALLALELGQHQAAARDLQRIAAVADRLPAHLRARHALVQARWQLERGLDSRAAAAQARALAPAGGWPEVRMAAELQAARLGTPAAQRRIAHRVAAAAEPHGLNGSVLAALLLASETLPGRDAAPGSAAERRNARTAAEQIERWAAAGVVPTLRPLAELWLGLARSWRAAGEPERATAAAAEGQAWLRERLAGELDSAAERETAAQRCPAHRALAEWAAAA